MTKHAPHSCGNGLTKELLQWKSQPPEELSYQERIDRLRATKMRHTEEKWRDIGIIDMDDHGMILPPAESRRYVQVISGSGVPMKDALFTEFSPKSNHPSGGFYGARTCGENFRTLLEMHPTYVDPDSSLAGGYMVNFLSYRDPAWNPDFDYSHLKARARPVPASSRHRRGAALLPGHEHRSRRSGGAVSWRRSGTSGL